MVPFAGFEMPVQYRSIKEEHLAVRRAVGLFDVSHMGQIHIAGPGALPSLERLASCPIATLRPGRVRYGLLCNEAGGVVDDVTVYRLGEEAFFLCVNAANIEKDYRWCVRHATADAEVRDRSQETGLLALQGPESAARLQPLTDAPLAPLRRFRSVATRVAGVEALVSRTGYTGSDGFELYLPAGHSVEVWKALCEGGALPCGLGARDTLRLEAALPLYGHELDDATSPLEAGLERFVKLESGGFLGAPALRRQRERGLSRRLVGFEMVGRGIARSGYPIVSEGEPVGLVTSGGPSPSLGKAIGLGYVPPALSSIGARLDIRVRERPVEARIVETPFV